MRFIGNVEKDAQVRAVASGALSTGDTVIVNSDGTVSVVEGTAQALGTSAVFESAQAVNMSTTFDSNSNKVVIAYTDGGNSSYGTAVVGTVSGTSISFGTPVVFASLNSSYISATFDSNSNKVVISYRDNVSGYGTAIVGTVSGTSISFGTAVAFESASTLYIGSTFDSNSGKVVIAYRDSGNSDYGTAIVGTVSGSSISFGTAVVYESANSSYNAAIFDSNSNKVVIAYQDVGNSNYGTAIVGTVSGSSISFGSPVVFESAASYYQALAFDSNLNKVVVFYRDGGNSNYGTASVGTVSGTSISFGTPVVFEEALSDGLAPSFDTNANKIVLFYRDRGNSNYGNYVVGAVSGTTITFETPVVFVAVSASSHSSTFDSNSNKVVNAYNANSVGNGIVFQNESTTLTSKNFLGFAAHTYADTQSALVNSTCTVDRNQTSLTAGQKYYVQTDGTLGTTAADPSVVAGTAISSTEIIVKG